MNFLKTFWQRICPHGREILRRNAEGKNGTECLLCGRWKQYGAERSKLARKLDRKPGQVERRKKLRELERMAK